MLPRIATPRVVPTSRVVSFIADPTPALSRGTDDMISSVIGVMVKPMPDAITNMPSSTCP